MRKIVLIAVLIFVMGFSKISFGAIIMSSFDKDADGWTTDAGGNIAYNSSGGNPGGFLSIEDIAGDTYVVFPPAKFKGDLLEFDGGRLSYDIIAIMPTTIGSGFGRIQLQGGGSNATFDYAPNPPIPSSQDWTNYYVPMTAEAWNATQENWGKILSDVTYFDIILEIGPGSDIVGLDNFKIKSGGKPVAEPATILLLGPALMGLIGIGRKKMQ